MQVVAQMMFKAMLSGKAEVECMFTRVRAQRRNGQQPSQPRAHNGFWLRFRASVGDADEAQGESVFETQFTHVLPTQEGVGGSRFGAGGQVIQDQHERTCNRLLHRDGVEGASEYAGCRQ